MISLASLLWKVQNLLDFSTDPVTDQFTAGTGPARVSKIFHHLVWTLKTKAKALYKSPVGEKAISWGKKGAYYIALGVFVNVGLTVTFKLSSLVLRLFGM